MKRLANIWAALSGQRQPVTVIHKVEIHVTSTNPNAVASEVAKIFSNWNHTSPGAA